MKEQQTTYILNGSITAEQPLATASKDLIDRYQKTHQPIPVPFVETKGGKRLMFPGTGIRGVLRRAVRDVVREDVINATGDQHPFSLEQHYLMTLGGIKGSGDQQRESIATEEEWRKKNPLLSLFGAGDAGSLGFVQGKLSVGNAICTELCDPLILSGARTDDLYRDKAQVKYLSTEDIDELIAAAKGGKTRSGLTTELKASKRNLMSAKRNKNADEEAAALQSIKDIEAKIADNKKTSGTSDVSIGMPLAGWESIPPGYELEHRMHLMRGTPVELGLLLSALNRVAALDPIIGAHVANGCGMISGRWDVYAANMEGKKLLGQISFKPFEPLVVEGKDLLNALSEYTKFAKSDAPDYSIPGA